MGTFPARPVFPERWAECWRRAQICLLEAGSAAQHFRRWISDMLGYPSDAAGILMSGGSMANLIALASARAKHNPHVLRNGRIYVSAEGHASVNKAAFILGFPAEAIQTIGVDDCFRIKTGELNHAIANDRIAGKRPIIVVVNGGTMNTGAIDPLPEICQRSKLWFHVDATYGGFAAISADGRRLLAGMELADSLTLDPHKWLYCPVGIGCVLVREQASLEHAFATEGDYLRISCRTKSTSSSVVPSCRILRGCSRSG